MPLWWIETAAKATKSPTTVVLIELLRLHWKTRSSTFPLPNSPAAEIGSEPQSEAASFARVGAGAIGHVERPARKSPVVTLNVL